MNIAVFCESRRASAGASGVRNSGRPSRTCCGVRAVADMTAESAALHTLGLGTIN